MSAAVSSRSFSLFIPFPPLLLTMRFLPPKLPTTNKRPSCPRQNGERSLSVPFTREDTASPKPDDKPQEKATDKEDAGGEGGPGNATPQKPSKSKLTQDFRTEKGFAGYAAAAQRGDLVTFDVVLNRG